jgi:hypothetical protein
MRWNSSDKNCENDEKCEREITRNIDDGEVDEVIGRNSDKFRHKFRIQTNSDKFRQIQT